MYVTMALEYERKCTLLCMLDQTRKTPLLSQHHDEGTPICIAALENYPYLAYLQKKIWLRHPYPTPPSYRNFWSGEGTLRTVRSAKKSSEKNAQLHSFFSNDSMISDTVRVCQPGPLFPA